jgi:hypothetical protein
MIAGVDSQKESEEVLFHVQSKISTHGYLNFLFLKDNKPSKILIYSYSIDTKEKKFYVSFLGETTIFSNEHVGVYKKSKEWNDMQKKGRNEKYYKIIHPNFLTISNKEKFVIIDSMSSKNHLQQH